MRLLRKTSTLKPTKLALAFRQTPAGQDIAVKLSTNRHSLLLTLPASVNGPEAFLRSTHPMALQTNKMASKTVRVCAPPRCALHRHDKIRVDPSPSLLATPQVLALSVSSRHRRSCNRLAHQASQVPRHCLSLICKTGLLLSMVVCDPLPH